MTRVLNYLRHNAIALAALFIALAGTSYAAMSIPANSVGSKQLRNKSVTAKKIAKHAVAAASLDPKSIAGHIADWAQVRFGKVTSSSPNASISTNDPAAGLVRVSWHKAIPISCVAIANPASVTPLGSATANTAGPEGRGASTDLIVETFNAAGNSVPENFNVVVICP